VPALDAIVVEKEDFRMLVPGAWGPNRQAIAARLAKCRVRWNQIGRPTPRLPVSKLELEVREGDLDQVGVAGSSATY
jgi:hypothetical protein